MINFKMTGCKIKKGGGGKAKRSTHTLYWSLLCFSVQIQVSKMEKTQLVFYSTAKLDFFFFFFIIRTKDETPVIVPTSDLETFHLFLLLT